MEVIRRSKHTLETAIAEKKTPVGRAEVGLEFDSGRRIKLRIKTALNRSNRNCRWTVCDIAGRGLMTGSTGGRAWRCSARSQVTSTGHARFFGVLQ